MPSKLTLNESEIIRLYNEFTSAFNIGKLFNCSEGTVIRVLKNNNVLISHKERMKKLFEYGKLKSWCDGLTKETDERVRKQAEKITGKRNDFKLINCIICKKEVLLNSRHGKYCPECKQIKLKEWRKNNYKKHKDKWLLTEDQKSIKKIYSKEYRIKNREILLKKQHERYYNNKEEMLLRARNWKKQNRDKMNEYKRRPEVKLKWNLHRIKKEKEDAEYNIIHRLRSNLNQALNLYTLEGKIQESKEYGIDYKKIIEHLKPFPENRELYHIDHKIPLCSFNFINEDGTTNFEEVRKAFAPENHQWLLAEDNLKKIQLDIKLSIKNRRIKDEE